jgi:C_GCAxxG_C_C family probable redox protein
MQDSTAQVAIPIQPPVTRFPGLAERARLRAEALYAQDELYCSEAVLTVVNDLTGRSMPPAVCRLATGFGVGMGDSGCSCGALSGGVMALGLLCGRDDGSGDWKTSQTAAAELHRRFRAEFGGPCCRSIVRRFGGMEGHGRHEHCTVVTGRTAALVFEVAEDQGLL